MAIGTMRLIRLMYSAIDRWLVWCVLGILKTTDGYSAIQWSSGDRPSLDSQENSCSFVLFALLSNPGSAVSILQVSVDMGAAWIHGTEGNPVTNLCEEASLSLFNTGGGTLFVDHMGR